MENNIGHYSEICYSDEDKYMEVKNRSDISNEDSPCYAAWKNILSYPNRTTITISMHEENGVKLFDYGISAYQDKLDKSGSRVAVLNGKSKHNTSEECLEEIRKYYPFVKI